MQARIKTIKIKKRTSSKIFDIINYVLLTLFAIVAAYPFLYILGVSFNDGADLLKGGIWLFPRKFTLQNYILAFTSENILSGFTVSISRTLIGTLASVALISMMAYALIDKKLIGRRFFLKFFFFTTLFSGGMIPFVVLLRDLNLLDNFWVYVLPALYSFYNMIIVRAAFESIPISLSESAKIDGAGDLTIFLKMYVPLNIPVFATIGLFTAVFHWNDWFAGSFYVTTASLKPAATILQDIINESMASLSGNHMNNSLGQGVSNPTPQSLQMAFVVIIVFPIVCVYPFLQKHFVKGVMIGSIKE